VDLTRLNEISFYGNPLWKWLVAVGIAVVTYFILLFLKSFVISRFKKFAERTDSKVDDFIADLLQRQTKGIFLLLFSLLAGTQFLDLPGQVDTIIGRIAVIVVCLQGALWASGVISYWLTLSLEQKKKEGDASSVSAFSAIGVAAKVALWSVVALVILNNFGVDITALVAGLGIGGIAVALALQNVLGDLFASMSIALDKPFVVGDFIVIGDIIGSVEHIGLKTTRLRSLSGEQIVVSNNDLLSSRIRNYKRMNKRRIVFSLGVTYQTPHEKLAAIPDIIREIFTPIDQVELDRVHFKSFGDFALNFEVVYHVAIPDYNTYMDVQQRINLDLCRRFADEGIEFAYPTQTLFLEKSTP